MFRVINEVRPTWFIGENVGGITTMVLPGEATKVGSYTDVCGENYTFYEKRQRYAIEQIRIDLASIGYQVQPIIIPACAVGAPHRRDRVWFIANRADTGVEDLQREWKDSIYATGFITDTDDSRLQEKGTEQQTTRTTGSGEQRDVTDTAEQGLQEWLDDERKEDAEETRAGMDDRLERHGGKRATPDPDGERCNHGSDNRGKRCVCRERELDVTEDKPKWDERERGVGEDGTVITNTDSNGLQGCGITGIDYQEGKESRNEQSAELLFAGWENFPTQSPVCGRDARLPFDVHDLTISYRQWREQSIKAYGNTMCVPVVYEIFKTIEQVEETFK